MGFYSCERIIYVEEYQASLIDPKFGDSSLKEGWKPQNIDH